MGGVQCTGSKTLSVAMLRRRAVEAHPLLPLVHTRPGLPCPGAQLTQSTFAMKLNGFLPRPQKRTAELLAELVDLAPTPEIAELLHPCDGRLKSCLLQHYSPAYAVGPSGSSCGESVAAAGAAAAARSPAA